MFDREGRQSARSLKRKSPFFVARLCSVRDGLKNAVAEAH
jgi:hypothetical protein